MRDVGDEVTAHVVDSPTFRHVMRDDDGMALVGRHDSRIKEHGAAARLKRVVAREFARPQPRAEIGLSRGNLVAKDRPDILGRDPEMNGRHGVDPLNDALLPFEDDDAFGKKFKRLPISSVPRLEPGLHVVLLIHDELSRIDGEERENRNSHAEKKCGRVSGDAQPKNGRNERDHDQTAHDQNAEKLGSAPSGRQNFGHGVSFV